jgi:HTH-type transcriptional regulator/antitoxin HigA
MAKPTERETWSYEPDEAIPPGATLDEWLNRLGMSQAQFARRTGLSAKHVNQVIKGSASLSPDVALLIENVIGVPARYWNRLEATYREHLLRTDQDRELAADTGWLKEIPWQELIKRGVLERGTTPVDQVRRLYRFFGVANREAYERIWRPGTSRPRLARGHPSNPHAVNAWLRIGEVRAASIECRAYDRNALLAALESARALTRVPSHHSWLPELQRICAAAGVALVIERELPQSRVNGAARWLTPAKALVQMSLRYRWYDVFWFTFFHETAHLLKHSKKRPFADERAEAKAGQSFVEDGTVDDSLEREADDFASKILIPSRVEDELRSLLTAQDIISFADRLGVSPGIVIGRLQYERRIPYNRFTELKQRFTFEDE